MSVLLSKSAESIIFWREDAVASICLANPSNISFNSSRSTLSHRREMHPVHIKILFSANHSNRNIADGIMVL